MTLPVNFRVSIHVEELLEFSKQKFTILDSTLTINMIMCDDESTISRIYKIVLICCAL